ncbi:MAG TPA: signal peptide peptidase SppA [Myxococcales bacterium]|nr:signal peptide peptidase SppA [Myxococcales bacterium]
MAFGSRAQVTQGAVTPGQSFSLQDDGTSLSGNPAGLGFVSGFEADFLHNGYYESGHPRIDALHLAGGLGPLALGLAFDWFNNDPTSYQRTSLGAALQLGGLSLGTAHRWFSEFGISTWDFGAIVRPVRFLSLGAAVLDANRPGSLPRRWQLSAGVRPLHERLDLAVDLRWSECTNSPTTDCGLDHKEWLFTAQGRLVRGLTLIGQVGLLDASQTTVLLGLQIDLAHAGVAYAPAFGSGDARSAWRIRASSEPWPSVSIPIRHAVEIDLKQALARPHPGPAALFFGASVRDPLRETLEALRRLSEDSSVAAVVLRTGGLPLGLARASELRAGIENLKASGKKVLFYLESGGDLEYSVALPADRIFAAPQAVLLVNGFSATALFAAAGLDKLGVKAEFFRVGAYKNAPDLFTRSGMSGEQREVETSILEDVYGRYVRRIAQARHLDETKVKSLLDEGILKPREAVEAGLIDGLVYPDQLEEEAGKILGGSVHLRKAGVGTPDERELRWAGRPRIGVVRVVGDIVRGDGARDPFGAVDVAGSDAISRRIRSLADDPRVAAIVVRIDSPGGDGNASDLIWRELVRARKEKKKKVIASMGDVAASGGYYVAAGADEIFARPDTITGSIGVFIGHFDASQLFGKLGLNLVTLKRGESADLFNPGRGVTDVERKRLQAWVEDFYESFLKVVAEARGLTRDQVDAVARGRVWSGAQAMERKLVDQMGGFEEALAEAKRLAGLDPDEDVELDDAIPLQVGVADFAGVSALDALPMDLGPRAIRALRLLGEPGTVRAALPYDLEVH